MGLCLIQNFYKYLKKLFLIALFLFPSLILLLLRNLKRFLSFLFLPFVLSFSYLTFIFLFSKKYSFFSTQSLFLKMEFSEFLLLLHSMERLSSEENDTKIFDFFGEEESTNPSFSSFHSKLRFILSFFPLQFEKSYVLCSNQ